MAKKKLGARAQRREAERQTEKFIRDKERLFLLEPGGSPERPIDLTSASEVEIQARSRPCPRCGGEVQVEEHLAQTVGSARLRIAKVACRFCGSKRSIYFRLGAAQLN